MSVAMVDGVDVGWLRLVGCWWELPWFWLFCDEDGLEKPGEEAVGFLSPRDEWVESRDGYRSVVSMVDVFWEGLWWRGVVERSGEDVWVGAVVGRLWVLRVRDVCRLHIGPPGFGGCDCG